MFIATPEQRKGFLCRIYLVTGTCEKGERCHFRHDDAKHEEYKAKRTAGQVPICKKFQTDACEMGERCIFLHKKAE